MNIIHLKYSVIKLQLTRSCFPLPRELFSNVYKALSARKLKYLIEEKTKAQFKWKSIDKGQPR